MPKFLLLDECGAQYNEVVDAYSLYEAVTEYCDRDKYAVIKIDDEQWAKWNRSESPNS